MINCAFENSPSIPSFLVTKIVYIGYGQLKKWLLFRYLSIAVLLHAGFTKPCEVGEIISLYRLKSLSLDYKTNLMSPCFFLQVTFFLLCFMVKLIVKTIVINGKIHKNRRKRLYSSSKEGLICWYKSITANFCKFALTKFKVNIKSQILKYTNKRFLYQIGRWIVLYSNYFHKTWVICNFLKAKQSTCLSFKHGDHGT